MEWAWRLQVRALGQAVCEGQITLQMLWIVENFRLQFLVEGGLNVCGMIGLGQRQVMIRTEMTTQED